MSLYTNTVVLYFTVRASSIYIYYIYWMRFGFLRFYFYFILQYILITFWKDWTNVDDFARAEQAPQAVCFFCFICFGSLVVVVGGVVGGAILILVVATGGSGGSGGGTGSGSSAWRGRGGWGTLWPLVAPNGQKRQVLGPHQQRPRVRDLGARRVLLTVRGAGGVSLPGLILPNRFWESQ